MDKAVRVRFAPSPTGALHIGGVRTALYNYLFARQHGGQFILRIEDTDQTRLVPWAEEYIINALKWLSLEADESPEKGGPYASYRQSERKDIYREYAEKLVQEGKAYYAFDTSQELDDMRTRLEASKAKNLSYNALTRRQMKNSFTLSKEEVEQHIQSGQPYVIRINMPLKEEIRFEDMVFGWIKVHSSTLDDKILLKSDGLPTYHLANVVDDYLMKISHVIRGKEWLPSTPLHVLLYQYLGWEDTMPQFAHLPLLLKPSGQGKLSKRDGIKFGFPVFPLEWMDEEKGKEVRILGFKNEGYLPEALLNFISLLGWNPGTEQELFSLEDLVHIFSLDRVGKNDPVFDIDKCQWFNQQYVKDKTDEELAQIILKTQASSKFADREVSLEKAQKIAALMKARITFPKDIWEDAAYLFDAPEEYDAKTIKKKWNEDAANFIDEYKEELKAFGGDWKADRIHMILEKLMEMKNLKFGKVMPALRVSITGLGGGPDLSAVMEIIGKEESIQRIETALHKIKI